MIYNPVIVSGGGQVFSITDQMGMFGKTSAHAGEIVYGTGYLGLSAFFRGIYAGDVEIPYRDDKNLNGSYFVMPASDVTIRNGGMDVDPPE